MTLSVGTKVRHRINTNLGIGKVSQAEELAGQQQVWVNWPNLTAAPYPAGDLEIVVSLVDELTGGAVGPAQLRPFSLRILGRWFEAQHALTGELTNQPFQMLPHQVLLTHRVITSDPAHRRWLIADDVGLGKTIEAGMIMEVLRKQTYGKFRCLVITPAGLQQQWYEEMKLRFRRRFSLFSGQANELEDREALIVSIDTLRSKRFEDALRSATPWSLIIFDEAHHLATDTSVLRYRLAKLLRDERKANNILLLTATPHSGKVDHFCNMLQILRPEITPERLKQDRAILGSFMARNRKSEVTDARGERIFKGTERAHIIRCTPTPEEVRFFEELLTYVRNGFRVADRLNDQKKGAGQAIGFLMAAFNKLASSSSQAIEKALRNRLEVLEAQTEVSAAAIGENADDRYQGEHEESVAARTAVLTPRGARSRRSPIEDEANQLRRLLAQLAALGPQDTKLQRFSEEVRKLRADVKVLIFTEYRGTQEALRAALERQFGADAVTTIHGSMGLDERRDHVQKFNEQAGHPRFMVSTEAGGEGLNMQKSCHVVFNYDLPWNPARLQQRIGRVYRYGQMQKVQVYNFKLEADSDAFADSRVETYLREKIRRITEALADAQGGSVEDIEGEVLGAVVDNLSIDELYAQALKKGAAEAIETIERQTKHIEEMVRQGKLDLFKDLRGFDISDYRKIEARVRTEHLDYFFRQYLAQQGIPLQRSPEGLLSFEVSEKLRQVAERLCQDDRTTDYDPLGKRVEHVSLDREQAQVTRNCRLLRFGDLAFDAMVRHVQDGAFGGRVATLRLPAQNFGWRRGDRGVCAVFDMKILASRSNPPMLLRNELVAYVSLDGQGPRRLENLDALANGLLTAASGPLDIQAAEVARAYTASRQQASSEDLKVLLQDAARIHAEKDAGLVTQLDDYALAWVEAI